LLGADEEQKHIDDVDDNARGGGEVYAAARAARATGAVPDRRKVCDRN